MKKVVASAIGFLFSFLTTAQIFRTDKAMNISEDEELFITRTIDSYLSKYDYVYEKPRKSEFILFILEIDSIGLVSKISFLSDEKNRDTTYSILSKITPEEFKRKKILSCKYKTILIPVYSIGPDFSSSYASRLSANMNGTFLNNQDFGRARAYRYIIPAYQY